VGTIEGMDVTQERIVRLVAKWKVDSEEYRLEARRLELVDRGRHAASIAMLEASAQSIEKCILELNGPKV
jgi:hypothetical protein